MQPLAQLFQNNVIKNWEDIWIAFKSHFRISFSLARDVD